MQEPDELCKNQHGLRGSCKFRFSTHEQPDSKWHRIKHQDSLDYL